ncbi:MAG: OmpA family protein [Halomonas sp.]|nr:OmpA family protein [Halomonas sp.]MBP5978680.1 OmpA family protein [Halomonas sp.]
MIKWAKPIILAVAFFGIVTDVNAQNFTNVRLEVTDIEPGYIRNGLFLPIPNIAQVQSGVGQLSKEQTVNLLGNPNDSTSSIQDDDWFYNINLPLENNDYLVCQYKLSFSNQTLSSFEWRRAQCGAMYAALAKPDVRSLSADLLFGFDSANISPGGISAIRQLAAEVLQNFNNPFVEVIGYTDQLGNASYNLNLSEQRARAVSIALIEGGISQQWITYAGRGESEPVVSCADSMPRPQLISCLAENRRVNIVLKERS